MIRACVFDLDGTIINTEESLVRAVNNTLIKLGYPETDREHVRMFIGHGGRQLIKSAVSLYTSPDEAAVDDAFKKYKEVFAECYTYGNTAYEGVTETLHELKQRGIKLAVISNKSQEGVESCIHKVFGGSLFDVIAGEKPGIPLKPDPTGILAVIDELGVRPEECLYVGDGETDMQGGRAAGCVTVGVTWGFRTREVLEAYHPDYMIDSMEDLIPLTPYVYVIDGKLMTDKDAFYDEIEKQLTDASDFRMGHNPDAFSDVLGGGFGKHAPGEGFCILWKSFSFSLESLGQDFVMKTVSIMLRNDAEYDCILKIKD